jgi:hypothetical protein
MSCAETQGTMLRRSYAVLWREGDGPVSAGKLVLGPTSLRLDTGSGRGRSSSKVLRYADLASVERATPAERIRSRPTAVVNGIGKGSLSIAAFDGMGSVREIVDQLAGQLVPKAVS